MNQQKRGKGGKNNRFNTKKRKQNGPKIMGGQGKHSNGKHSKGYPMRMKGGKKNYHHSHPNFGYLYENKHGYFSHRNYGQWRSQQARMKHKKYRPVHQYQAVEGFNLIIGRNVFLYSETAYKINLLKVKLGDKRKAGDITVVQYNNSMRRISVLEERRANLVVNIDL